MVKLTEMSTNYHDALLHQPPQAGPLNAPHLIHFAPKAREGVRSQQILIDLESDQGQVLFANNPITMLKGRFDKALQDTEGTNRHKTRPSPTSGTVCQDMDFSEKYELGLKEKS